VKAYQTFQYVVPRGGNFLGKWRSSFVRISDGKMNVHSACALNTQYYLFCFINLLYNNAIVNLEYIAPYDRTINELEITWMEAVMIYLKLPPGFHTESLKKITKTCQDNRVPANLERLKLYRLNQQAQCVITGTAKYIRCHQWTLRSRNSVNILVSEQHNINTFFFLILTIMPATNKVVKTNHI
jgi:hypothetical protein